MRTFTAFFEQVEADALRDGLAAVFNFGERGSQVHIRSVRVSSPSPWGTFATLAGKWCLMRTTDQSGGREIAAARHGAGTLPAQVLVREFPDSVADSGETFRCQGDAINAWWSQAYQSGARFHGQPGRNGAELYRAGHASTQGIFLAEGEGIALVQRLIERPRQVFVSVTFRTGTGATFTSAFHCGTPAQIDGALFGVFNGVGSGVTLEIVSVHVAEEGSPEPPIYRMLLLDGADGGSEITPAAHRAGDTPHGVRCLAGAFRAAPLGEKSAGVPIQWHTAGVAAFTLTNQHRVGTLRRKSLGPLNPASCPKGDPSLLYISRPGCEGITLNPGVGLGIVNMSEARNDSAYAYANIEIVFTQESVPGASRTRILGGI